jgi:hypothetical protein
MWRWVVQIATTGAGSLLLLLVLIWLKAGSVLGALMLPFAWIAGRISDWIEATWPSQDGGWPKGIASGLVVDGILTWLFLWLILLIVVRLPLHSKKTRDQQ